MPLDYRTVLQHVDISDIPAEIIEQYKRYCEVNVHSFWSDLDRNKKIAAGKRLAKFTRMCRAANLSEFDIARRLEDAHANRII